MIQAAKNGKMLFRCFDYCTLLDITFSFVFFPNTLTRTPMLSQTHPYTHTHTQCRTHSSSTSQTFFIGSTIKSFSVSLWFSHLHKLQFTQSFFLSFIICISFSSLMSISLFAFFFFFFSILFLLSNVHLFCLFSFSFDSQPHT